MTRETVSHYFEIQGKKVVVNAVLRENLELSRALFQMFAAGRHACQIASRLFPLVWSHCGQA